MKTIFSILVAFMFLNAGSSSATILFGPATNISGDSDVSTVGTLVGAFNMGNTGLSSTTVNGVTFAPFALVDNPTTVGNYKIEETLMPAGFLTFGNTAYCSASAPFSNLSASYRALLASGIQSGFSEIMVLTLNGLTIGQFRYTFTTRDWRTAAWDSSLSAPLLPPARARRSPSPASMVCR